MMTRGLIVLAAALMVVACGRMQPAERPGVPAIDPAPLPLQPPAVDLTGSWYVGTGVEPQVATITLHPSCAHNPAQWLIKQTGNAIEAWTFPESFNQGIKNPGPGPARIVPARGTISGAEVVLNDDGSRVELRYDSVSTHLRGTRDGRTFWAVRQVIVRSVCPGIP